MSNSINNSQREKQQVWLITGCSSGLGASLCKAVLNAGHIVIATSRNVSRTSSSVLTEIEALGGTWLELDVTQDESSLKEKVDSVVKRWGRIDVLVNNAGFAMAGTVEDMSLHDAQSLFSTNFWGPLQLIKLITPIMRAQGSGTIVNISSGACIKALPTIGLYGASKCALEGLTETLHTELSPFNIRVILAVPGDMRTNFVSPTRIATNVVPLSAAYKGTMVEQIAQYLVNAMHGGQSIDPERAAARIVERVTGTGMFADGKGEADLRLLIGKETGDHLKERLEELRDVLERQEKVWRSVDFE